MTAQIVDCDDSSQIPEFLLELEAGLYAGDTRATYWQTWHQESLLAARFGYLVERAANPGQLWDRLAEVTP